MLRSVIVNIGLIMKRAIGCVSVAAVLATVACANGRGIPTSPTQNQTGSNAAAAAPGNSGTPLTGIFAVNSSAAGCPAWGNPGGNPGVKFVGIMSPADAVALSVAQITDAWYLANGAVKADFIADRLAGVSAIDKNGDGLLCVALSWGQELNPNAHWALYDGNLLDPAFREAWFFADNHTGTSNKN
jgi:hypothetical protein